MQSAVRAATIASVSARAVLKAERVWRSPIGNAEGGRGIAAAERPSHLAT
jgi:hypothetical protein